MKNGKYKMIFAHCKKTFTFWGIISIASWHYTEWIWKDLAIFYSSHCCAVLSNVRLFVTPYAVAFSVHGDFPGKNTGVGCHTLLRGSSQPRDQTQVSRIAGRFFTSWATREDPLQTLRCYFKFELFPLKVTQRFKVGLKLTHIPRESTFLAKV